MQRSKTFRVILAFALIAVFAFQSVACKNDPKPTNGPDVSILTPPPGSLTNPDGQGNTVNRNGYSVSTSNAFATAVAAQVLDGGGNAVDAAIAAAYTLGIVEPYGSGIGGGGGMTIYDPVKNEYKFLDYLAQAPSSGSVHLNIGVPGFVSGMQTAYDMYGTKPFAELLQPAIDYAENGYVVDDDLFYRINNARNSFSANNTPYAGIQQAGDILVQTEAANILRTIASEGSSSFYTGSISQLITASTGMDANDLASYQTLVSDAVTGSFAGYTVASASAPFSGVTLIQQLELCEILNIPNPSENPSGYLETLSKVMMACGNDRVNKLCDPRFDTKERDYQRMVSRDYVCNLFNSDYSDFEQDDEGQDTTHISIIDTNGMAVACTNTLTQFFGSKLYVNGFFLNNALRNFGTKGINNYAPGKRMRTYMCPTIFRKDNGDTIVAGTPGGTVILSVMTTVLTDNILFGTNIQDAVNKRRIVVKSLTALYYEDGFDQYPMIVDPSGLGYYAVPMSLDAYFGSMNIASFSPTIGFYATADLRRLGSGRAANY